MVLNILIEFEGSSVPIEVISNMTVLSVKQLFCEKLKMSLEPERIAFLLQGKEMNNNDLVQVNSLT